MSARTLACPVQLLPPTPTPTPCLPPAQILCGFIGNVKDRGMLALLPVMDAVIQVGAGALVKACRAPAYGWASSGPAVGQQWAGLARPRLSSVLGAHPCCTARPPQTWLQCFPSEGPALLAPALRALLGCLLGGRESGLVVAAALGVYARVLLHNGPAFLGIFQAAAAGGLAPPADAPEPGADPAARLLLALVDLWLDKFDSIGQPGARKLSALALCVLLTAPLPPLLERVELISAHVTSVWFEVRVAWGLAAEAACAVDLGGWLSCVQPPTALPTYIWPPPASDPASPCYPTLLHHCCTPGGGL